MKRVWLIAVVLAFGLSLTPPSSVQAAQNCTGANCGTKSKKETAPGQTPKKGALPKKRKQIASPVAQKQGKGRSEYSAEQRAKVLEHARAVCREKFGASSTVYRVDYKKWRVTCVPPGY